MRTSHQDCLGVGRLRNEEAGGEENEASRHRWLRQSLPRAWSSTAPSGARPTTLDLCSLRLESAGVPRGRKRDRLCTSPREGWLLSPLEDVYVPSHFTVSSTLCAFGRNSSNLWVGAATSITTRSSLISRIMNRSFHPSRVMFMDSLVDP